MEKERIWRIILLLILILFLSFFYLNFRNTGEEITYTHAYTKAICNETNFCEDYHIVCKKERLVMMNPTGAVIQHDENWKDPRGENKNENLC